MSLPRYEQVGRFDDRIVIRAYGPTLPELFENAADAMFAMGRDLTGIPPTYSRPLVAPGDSYEELLFNWLDELLYVGSAESLVWSSNFVDRLEVGGVQGSASGQPSSNVPPAQGAVSEVVDVRSDIVAIPDGYWVEVEFAIGTPLRAL